MWSSRTAEVLEAEWVDTIGTGSYLGTHWWSVAPRKSGVSPTLTGWLSEARGPMGRLWGSERRWAVVTREIKNWSWWPFVAMTTDNLSSSKFVRANFILVLQRKREARKKVPSIWKRVVETLTAHPSFLGSVGKERCLCVHRCSSPCFYFMDLVLKCDKAQARSPNPEMSSSLPSTCFLYFSLSALSWDPSLFLHHCHIGAITLIGELHVPCIPYPTADSGNQLSLVCDDLVMTVYLPFYGPF